MYRPAARSVSPHVEPLKESEAIMAVSVPTITCPYCRFTFVNVRVTKHGLIRCGNCSKTMKI